MGFNGCTQPFVALEAQDVTKLQDLKKQITFSVVDVSSAHNTSTCAIPLNKAQSLLVSVRVHFHNVKNFKMNSLIEILHFQLLANTA